MLTAMKKVRTMKKKIINKCISIILLLALLIGVFSGCFAKKQRQKPADVSNVDVSRIVESVTESIKATSSSNTVNKSDWKSLVGNLDAFVYSELMSEYSLVYETFNTAVVLKDGSHVYGIGYSDYDSYFERDDGKGGYFQAGFISYIGEPEIPDDQRAEGLEIIDLDCEDTTYGFVLSYDTKPYMEHCVIWGQYLKYGIDSKGAITYQTQEYKRGFCDESLGALYSFDEKKFVFNPDVGNYTPVTGVSLYETVNYASIENEINRLLKEQDANFSEADVESSLNIAQEAVSSYFLSLKEETFMGYKVSDLVKLASEIDAKECIRISPEGYAIVSIDNAPPEKASALVKWLTGITCAIVIVASIVVDIYVPALAPLMGAVQGVAIEVFMQVVLENHTLQNVNWVKVGIAAVAAALVAWVCPALGSVAARTATKGAAKVVTILGKAISAEALKTIGIMCGKAIQSISSSIVVGITAAAFKYIDGGSKEDIFNTFIVSAALACALSVVLSALSSIGSRVADKTLAIINKRPNSFLSKIINTGKDKISTFIDKHPVHHLKNDKIENILVPKSIHAATKQALNEIPFDDIIKQLPSPKNPNYVMTSLDGTIIKSKAQLKKIGGNCKIKLSDSCDDVLRSKWTKFNVKELNVVNGRVDMKPFSMYEFNPFEGITRDRSENMSNYYKQLANTFKKGRKFIPDKLKDLFANISDTDISNLNASKVSEILSNAGFTLHEGTDGVVYVVDFIVHEKLSHYGGVAWAKVVGTIQTGNTYFKDIVQSKANSITGSLVSEGVG